MKENYLNRVENIDIPPLDYCIHVHTYIYRVATLLSTLLNTYTCIPYISFMIILLNTKYNVYIEFQHTLTVTFSSRNILMCTFSFFSIDFYKTQPNQDLFQLFVFPVEKGIDHTYNIALLHLFFFTYDDHKN